MGVTLSQMFPPLPTFTEAQVPSQKGRVFIVTGGYSGVGYHVCSILYHAGGKVYMAGRSEEKARSAIENITSNERVDSMTDERGSLQFLPLDLSDLASIKASAAQFISLERHLHVLFNNAGVSLPPQGSKSRQDYELQMATNCLGPFLFTQLLLPQLKAAAATAAATAATSTSSDQGSPVRVVWTSSQVVELTAPNGGIDLTDLTKVPTDQNRNYTNSKTGNYFLASEFAKRFGNQNGILSVTTNPGALKTDLLRHKSSLFRLAVAPLMYPPINGAYTELFAGLSPTLSVEGGDGGQYIIPWGRVHPGMRADLLKALKSEDADGGTGVAEKFWDWCEGEVREYS